MKLRSMNGNEFEVDQRTLRRCCFIKLIWLVQMNIKKNLNYIENESVTD